MCRNNRRSRVWSFLKLTDIPTRERVGGTYELSCQLFCCGLALRGAANHLYRYAGKRIFVKFEYMNIIAAYLFS